MKNMGLIEPEEERRQWVFHVMVSDRYSEWRESELAAAQPQVKAFDVETTLLPLE